MKKKIKEKKHNRFANTKYTFHFVKLAFNFSPGFVILNFIQSVLFNNLSLAIYILFFTVKLYNMLEQNVPFSNVLILVLIFMGYFLLSSVFSNWFNAYYRPIQVTKLNYKFSDMILKKVASIDISCYENVEFYNTFVAASQGADGRAVSIMDEICNFIGAFISLFIFLGTLVALDAIFLLFIVLPVILSFVMKIIGTRLDYKFNMEMIPFNRKKSYVSRTIMMKSFAKDFKTSNLFEVFKKIYNDGFNGVTSVVDKYKHKRFIRNMVARIVGFALSFYPGWLYAAYKIMVVQSLQMSDYILIATAISSGRRTLDGFFERINALIEHGLYVQNFKKLMEYIPKIDQNQDGIKPPEIPSTLSFRNVSFTYEGQTAPVLKNISFDIGLNSTIAVLGHNGAGKSTLVKLIMRLYDPDEGEILLNNINIKKYDMKEYKKLITTVFQKPQLFALSIKENVEMGNMSDGVKDREDIIEHRVISAIHSSGLEEKINSLSKGINSVITKEFDTDGVEFSGGEYQKIAIARAMFKDSPMIILDEPSSSLDPIAEYEMYEKIKSLYTGEKNKLVVLISHRMSCALLADNVILLENGSIIENGTHNELMQRNGKYKEMFEKQKSSYEYEKDGEMKDEIPKIV